MTAPSGPASINDDHDIRESTEDILTSELAARFDVPVTGIFEASILTAMSLLKPTEQWGIVTTGRFWEKHLCDGVSDFLGVPASSGSTKFAGVFSSGLTAGDFHTVSPAEVQEKLSLAVRRLLKAGNIACVVMGCGGMVGLEDTIRSTAVEVYGISKADNLDIVDGVKAGILQLHQSMVGHQIFKKRTLVL